MNEIGPQLSLSSLTFPSVECVCLGLRFPHLQMLKLLTKCVLQGDNQCICCALSSKTSDKDKPNMTLLEFSVINCNALYTLRV